jgi:hypothetical protein
VKANRRSLSGGAFPGVACATRLRDARVFSEIVRCFGGRRDALPALITCLVVTFCFFLPTKQLDAKVGPIAYDDISLSGLCDRLREDYGIICRVPDRPGQACRLSFFTDRPLSRRKVLEKLSKETDRPLCIGFCATNATILFGAYPSFTYLGPERAAPTRVAGRKNLEPGPPVLAEECRQDIPSDPWLPGQQRGPSLQQKHFYSSSCSLSSFSAASSTSLTDAELTQNLKPVGGGPSSKTCPR